MVTHNVHTRKTGTTGHKGSQPLASYPNSDFADQLNSANGNSVLSHSLQVRPDEELRNHRPVTTKKKARKPSKLRKRHYHPCRPDSDGADMNYSPTSANSSLNSATGISSAVILSSSKPISVSTSTTSRALSASASQITAGAAPDETVASDAGFAMDTPTSSPSGTGSGSAAPSSSANGNSNGSLITGTSATASSGNSNVVAIVLGTIFGLLFVIIVLRLIMSRSRQRKAQMAPSAEFMGSYPYGSSRGEVPSFRRQYTADPQVSERQVRTI